MSAHLESTISAVDAILEAAAERRRGSDLPRRVRALVEQCRSGEPEAALRATREHVAGLELSQIVDILSVLTNRFHLVNKAEQLEIARINQERRAAATRDEPRPESIPAAIAELARADWSYDRVLELLDRLDIQPTLTAHPTEARRQTLLYKQQEAATAIEKLASTVEPGYAKRAAEARLHELLEILLATDEVRAERLQVHEEVRNGVYFLAGSIWDTVPDLYRDCAAALETYYGQRPELPTFLRYRSWIGGDRDGNPFVTPEVTRETFASLRGAALRGHRRMVERLRRELSISSRQVETPDRLRAAVSDPRELDWISDTTRERYRHEPYRLRLAIMRAKLRMVEEDPSAYSADAYRTDLDELSGALRESGFSGLADRGVLADARVLARTFGFHLAALDVRQHSGRHHDALRELLAAGNVVEDFGALNEAERRTLLRRELCNPRPLVGPDYQPSETTAAVLDAIGVYRDALRRDPAAVGSYVISMTHEVSDVLSTLLLMKERGLWSRQGDRWAGALDVAPLFETVDDLDRGPGLLREMLDDEVYRGHLEQRGWFQELMLGYSDSNKDGGYWMSNCALHRGQDELAQICQAAGLDFRFFHGRGGTVGRGGGRANHAIRANPVTSHNGRIRFTEQGEVITFRYALAAIAHRHLEQIVNAMIVATAEAEQAAVDPEPKEEEVAGRTGAAMRVISAASMARYRSLIDSDAFWDWYRTVSPIEHIGRLPIASRPVSRQGGSGAFENLRAIPWVFAWTQMRYTAPGWFGVGSGLDAYLADEPDGMKWLQRWYREWPFFRAVIDNAQQEMARGRLETGAQYAEAHSAPVHAELAGEFQRARARILELTGQSELLDNNPVIQRSIARRNPYTDVLNMVQVDLLRRYRDAVTNGADEDAVTALRSALFLSINGLAAAMQSTG